jgi:5-methyltetrahydrofolate--homocysteine methyltransferase
VPALPAVPEPYPQITGNRIEAALKKIGGRCIINSINLEDGGKRAEKILQLAREYGAAVVALTIDEKGMAETVERKLEVAEKLYHLIVDEFRMQPSDILFDPLTFTLASGDPKYVDAGIQTLKAIRKLKQRFPGSFTMIGLSNISFGLTPNIRHYLNSVFLYHAVEAGLDAAILHAGKIKPLNQIPEDLKKVCEDLIFNRRTKNYDPLQKLIELGQNVQENRSEDHWKNLTVEEQLKQHIILGRKKGLEDTLHNARKKYSPLDIINRFLLDGMKVVGDLFGEGKMQLPFVLKSAEVMKEAVALLEPYMEKKETKRKARIVLATVKGDVHDIGKNLVDIILSNNGYEVINLGIKQTIENITEAIGKYHPDCIGMSGLLVKSTLIMKENLQILNQQGIRLPVICGGAALNRRFVEQELKPSYRGPVFYGRDAMVGLHIMEKISSGQYSEENGKEKKQNSESLNPTRGTGIQSESTEEPLRFDHNIPTPPFWGRRMVTGIPLEAILPYLNKRILFKGRWQLKGNMENTDLHFDPENELKKLLKEGIRFGLYDFKVVYGYFEANAIDNQHIKVKDPVTGMTEVFHFPMQNKPPFLSLARYFLEEQTGEKDIVAFHLVTVGRKLSGYIRKLYEEDKYVKYLLWHGLSVELAEALAEYWHLQIRKELSIHQEDGKTFASILKGNYRGRRYSFGYPACPNLEDQKKIFTLLKPQEIGVELTDEYQLVPEQSTSAIIIHHPQARYFVV